MPIEVILPAQLPVQEIKAAEAVIGDGSVGSESVRRRSPAAGGVDEGEN